MFPDAYYIHIVRDGRDVAFSTTARYDWLTGCGEASAFNCLRRWSDFETAIRGKLPKGYRYLSLTYESLVQNPAAHLAEISTFLGLDYERYIATIRLEEPDLPEWEQGACDVRRSGGMIRAELKRYGSAPLNVEQNLAFNAFNDAVVRFGYESSVFQCRSLSD
jgi:hypothetical protein